MEHKGISYRVVQTANPTGWKWTIELPGKPPKSGKAASRTMAVRMAEIAIDKAIKVKRQPKRTIQASPPQSMARSTTAIGLEPFRHARLPKET
jgi:hypothetical protein